METNTLTTAPDLLLQLRQLTLPELTKRLDDLNAERAAVQLLRRSIAARDRALRRAKRLGPPAESEAAQ
jgi:hypothetical protein